MVLSELLLLRVTDPGTHISIRRVAPGRLTPGQWYFDIHAHGLRAYLGMLAIDIWLQNLPSDETATLTLPWQPEPGDLGREGTQGHRHRQRAR